MKNNPEVIQQWIDEINDNAVNLTKWEEGFMRNITHNFPIFRNLSEKQEEILERIYAEKTP